MSQIPQKLNGYRPLARPHQPLTDANAAIDPSFHTTRFRSMYSESNATGKPAVYDSSVYAVALVCGIAGLLYLTS